MTIAEKPQKASFHVLKEQIGNRSTIPGWPGNNLEGLFDALQRWTLCPRNEGTDDPGHPHASYSKPFRCLAWGNCIAQAIPESNCSKTRYIGTKPLYLEHPDAVSYFGNFLGFSFGFRLDTADPALIEKLDALIAANMATPAYLDARQSIKNSIWR